MIGGRAIRFPTLHRHTESDHPELVLHRRRSAPDRAQHHPCRTRGGGHQPDRRATRRRGTGRERDRPGRIIREIAAAPRPNTSASSSDMMTRPAMYGPLRKIWPSGAQRCVPGRVEFDGGCSMCRSYQKNPTMRIGDASRPATTPGWSQPSGTPRLMAISSAPTPPARRRLPTMSKVWSWRRSVVGSTNQAGHGDGHAAARMIGAASWSLVSTLPSNTTAGAAAVQRSRCRPLWCADPRGRPTS